LLSRSHAREPGPTAEKQGTGETDFGGETKDPRSHLKKRRRRGAPTKKQPYGRIELLQGRVEDVRLKKPMGKQQKSRQITMAEVSRERPAYFNVTKSERREKTGKSGPGEVGKSPARRRRANWGNRKLGRRARGSHDTREKNCSHGQQTSKADKRADKWSLNEKPENCKSRQGRTYEINARCPQKY